MNGKYSIEVNALSKKFGKFTAVNDISFNVEKGEIFGFLGANGAGKSTTIRMLCALLMPSSGSAKVAGYDISSKPDKVKANIGYMSQKFSLYSDLTVEENIMFFGSVYGIPAHDIKKRMSFILEMAGLKQRGNSLTKELAGGFKQRLALGCAILHDPKVVFLDEPTSGVDPVSRRNFWELINKLSENGMTIFVTTHYLDEAEYCNRIMLIHSGKIIAGASPEKLKSEHIKTPIYEIECNDPINAMEILKKQDFVEDVSVFGAYIHANIYREEDKNLIKKAVAEKGITVKRTEKITPSLEDVFIHLIEKSK